MIATFRLLQDARVWGDEFGRAGKACASPARLVASLSLAAIVAAVRRPTVDVKATVAGQSSPKVTADHQSLTADGERHGRTRMRLQVCLTPTWIAPTYAEENRSLA